MAHESFADPRIARLLNENFIPVKIDREERPDIDRQYMDFLQATTGGGGWPLNVFVTPQLEPVFGGTYWPGPSSERKTAGGPGFEQIITRIACAWREDEGKIRMSGRQIVQQLSDFAREGNLGGTQGRESGDDDVDGLDLDLLDEAYQFHRSRFDKKCGGFGAAPKFPTPAHVKHLLRLGSYSPEVREVVGEEECLQARNMALHTLEAMAKGGIKDQIGHGFARYSVTRDWSLPHFEKMLYDNAQLLPLYLDAYLATKSPLFLDMTHDIAKYITSEPMVSALGGIHSSEDADSLSASPDGEKREGAYYVWTWKEMCAVLTEREAKVCARYWGVSPDGNIDPRFDIQGELEGQNTLCVQSKVSDLAREFNVTADEAQQLLAEGRRKLLAHREQHRARPALDDKIVTSWNGLAIGGLARAGSALQFAPYISAAEEVVKCIRAHLFDDSNSTLRRVYREGPGTVPGFADDYAFLIAGLIDLYQATFDDSHLALADRLQRTQKRLFWDDASHAFFSTPAGQEDILIRVKDGMDNAEPSTNGVSATNLFRLGSLLHDAEYERLGRQTVAAFEVEMGQHPGLYSGLMAPVVASKLGMKGIVVSGEDEVSRTVVKRFHETLAPNHTLLKIVGGVQDAWLRQRNGLLRHLDADKAMVQVCSGGACKILEGRDIEGLFEMRS